MGISYLLSDSNLVKRFWNLIKTSWHKFQEDNAQRLGAALAYYTVFSFAPLLLIAIAAAGFFLGQEAVQDEILRRAGGFLGKEGAETVETMIAGAYNAERRISAQIVGIFFLIVGATGVLVQLQDALDTVWSVEREKTGFLRVLWSRLVSLGIILAIGFLLLISLIVSAALSYITKFAAHYLPFEGALALIVDLSMSITFITLFLAVLYKYLPNIIIPWREVWFGSFVTALLFTLGKYLLVFYIGRAAVSSAYGAVGSLIVLLLWSYYSAQIFLFGAEIIETHAKVHGCPITPKVGFKFRE